MNSLTSQRQLFFDEKVFINFLLDQGIDVKTNTKAKGNLGVCYANRIDISKNASKERRITILAHEYAHKVHLDLEKDKFGKGGSLEKLFDTLDIEVIKNELIRVTHFVDENSLFLNFHKRQAEMKIQIKEQEDIIRQFYPDFKRSYDFKPIKDYFKKNRSNAKHLLKFDNVKIVHAGIFKKKEEFISIKTLDKDFPNMPEPFIAYIRLNSILREKNRLSRRKSKVHAYYNRPTELFARLVEGLFADSKVVKQIAPTAYARFYELLGKKYYGKLKDLLDMARVIE